MPNSVGTNLGGVGLTLSLSTVATNLDSYFMFYHLGSNVFRVYSLNSGLPLSATNNAANGQPVFQDWEGTNSLQRWQICFSTGNFTLQNLGTQQAMDLGAGGGTSVVLNTPTNDVASQLWTLKLVKQIGPTATPNR
jgi:hypothetical protein